MTRAGSKQQSFRSAQAAHALGARAWVPIFLLVVGCNDAAKVVWTSPPQVIVVGECSQQFTGQIQDAFGRPAPGGRAGLTLPEGFRKFGDKWCTTRKEGEEIGSVNPRATFSFFLRGVRPVTAALTLGGPGLIGDTQELRVVALPEIDGGTGGGAGGGGGNGGGDGGTVPFDGGRGYCAGNIDGGWSSLWEASHLTNGGNIIYTQTLTAVWGFGPSDVWAVGSNNTPEGFEALVLHWDGTVWTEVPVPSTAKSLNGVWGAGPNDVWAVGNGGTLLHWDGSAWTSQSSGTNRNLGDVWGTSPSNVFVVGGGFDGSLVLRWNGSVWAPVSLPSPQPDFGHHLDAIHGSGPTDLWAIGQIGTAFHFNGVTWSSANSGLPPRGFYGAFVLSPTDAWAAGDLGTLAHWDGTTWTQGAVQTNGVLRSVWGPQGTDLWTSDGLNCMRWNGAFWTRAPWGLGAQSEIRAFWGTGPDDIWAVGTHVLHYP